MDEQRSSGDHQPRFFSSAQGRRRRRRPPVWAAALVALAVVGAGTAGALALRARSPADAVLLAAGDIASCASDGDEATTALLERETGTASAADVAVAAVGDDAYESGTAAEFRDCYEPTWGRHKGRTYPAVGNHEYRTAGAAPYFSYFGAAAGDPTKGYYSYDLGAWHVVVLNSECRPVGGCGPGSPQETWLRADLAASSAKCTLAYWHHPHWSSGRYGNDARLDAVWRDLYDAGADVVVSAHSHNYERFAPLDPAGAVDPARGVRQFVVGTGGRSHHPFTGPAAPGSEVRDDATWGVLKLTLRAKGYDWRFLPVAGQTFTDAGSGACH